MRFLASTRTSRRRRAWLSRGTCGTRARSDILHADSLLVQRYWRTGLEVTTSGQFICSRTWRSGRSPGELRRGPRDDESVAGQRLCIRAWKSSCAHCSWSGEVFWGCLHAFLRGERMERRGVEGCRGRAVCCLGSWWCSEARREGNGSRTRGSRARTHGRRRAIAGSVGGLVSGPRVQGLQGADGYRAMPWRGAQKAQGGQAATRRTEALIICHVNEDANA